MHKSALRDVCTANALASCGEVGDGDCLQYCASMQQAHPGVSPMPGAKSVCPTEQSEVAVLSSRKLPLTVPRASRGLLSTCHHSKSTMCFAKCSRRAGSGQESLTSHEIHHVWYQNLSQQQWAALQLSRQHLTSSGEERCSLPEHHSYRTVVSDAPSPPGAPRASCLAAL